MSPYFNKVHHIAIICSDYAVSKEFYVNVLKLPIIRETFRKERNSYKLDLDGGQGVQIELFSFPNPPKRASQPEAAGLRHLAFAVSDICAVCEYLCIQGVETEPIRLDELTGKHFTFFKDPDGLPIEIVEE
ncbi:MAG TPA: VOC family protein [Caproiciproducens sp.]|nr:VOC family protein [Caproiciproducens sp.]